MQLEDIARELLDLLKGKRIKLATCESMTGGYLGATITSIPGASEVFLGGFIAYSYLMKKLLGIPEEIIREYGAVSSQVALEMGRATAEFFPEDPLLVISVTGNAGPTALESKPVGLYYVSFVLKRESGIHAEFKEVQSMKRTRREIIEEAAQVALRGAIEFIQGII